MKQLHNITISPNTVLFFDLDGTLIDTDIANRLAYEQAICAAFGAKFEIPNSTERLTRITLKSMGLSAEEFETVITLKERYYHGFLPTTKLNKRAAKILDTYCAAHQTVLVTNCRQERALATLDYHKLTDKFSRLFFRQFSVGNEKINKFANAIQTLGISPLSVVAFENEVEEIEDARRAGIPNMNILKF